MKLLLDENIPPSLKLRLIELGYEVRHVMDIGMNACNDFKIAEFAASNSEIIVTHDTDFGTILALSGKSKPSVILFRWQMSNIDNFVQFFQTYLPVLSEILNNGALVVVEEDKIRVKELPLNV